MKRLHFFRHFILIFASLVMFSCNDVSKTNNTREDAPMTWEEQLGADIQLLGHRNWIVVVDAAYPLQSNPGITTIASDKGHLETIQIVSKLIQAQEHIKPIVYLDKEIDYVKEEDAAGITDFRNSLQEIIDLTSSKKEIHEDIISMLDEASELFNILIIKTNFTIPYTSVFFQLDCKYWDGEAEKELRKQLSAINDF